MLVGHWRYVIAVGLALWHPALAAAQTQNDSGVAVEAPSVEENASGQSDAGEHKTGWSGIPVRIIEDPIEAERRQAREEEADRQQAQDLEAQQQSAAAAQRSADADESAAAAANWQIIPTWVQLFIAVIGTGALLYTLYLTRLSIGASEVSANAAVEANRITRELFVEAERPRLVLDSFKYEAKIERGEYRLTLILTAKNTGRSPAVGVMFWSRMRPMLPNGDVAGIFGNFLNEPRPTFVFENSVGQGESFQSGRTLLTVTKKDIEALNGPKEARFVYAVIVGFIEYGFAFDNERRRTPFVLLGGGSLALDEPSDAPQNFVHLPSPVGPT